MNNRLNFGLLLIFLILINLKVILINEETLILVCFVTFCSLVTARLGSSIADSFEAQVNIVKSNFLKPSFSFITVTKHQQATLLVSLPWPSVFLSLKKDIQELNLFLFSQFYNFYTLNLNRNLCKKLEFTKRFESQITKLVLAIISEKLQKITEINSFCITTLAISSMKAINKVYFREHLQKLVL